MAHADLSGMTFGRLAVVRYDSNRIVSGASRHFWLCRCDCGNEVVVSGRNLASGNSESCGCNKFGGRPGNPSHSKSGTPEHIAWKGMRQRCLNPKAKLYKYWGARGITICKRWDSFENFLADMGPIPGKGYSLERKKVNGNYCKTNCEWIPRTKQSRNRRDSVRLTLDGVTRCMADWADHLGVPYQLLRGRKTKGWSDERILTAPRMRG